MASVVPRCVSLVLCDRIDRHPDTGVPTLVGALDVFQLDSFPGTTGPFSVWIQIANGNGAGRIELIIEHIPAGKLAPDVVVRAPFSLDFRNPNEVLEHVAVFDDGIDFDGRGRYRLRLIASGMTIARRYFVVTGTQ